MEKNKAMVILEDINECGRPDAHAKFINDDDFTQLRLHFKKFENIIEEWYRLAKKGQIELVCSAFYHPILPLISDKQIEHQINLSLELFEIVFPKIKIVGFYPPEMAYASKLEPLLKKMNFEWFIVDEMAIKNKIKIMKDD